METQIIKVLEVEHYTDRLFRFTTNRPAGFRFTSGEFAMLGQNISGKNVFRAYSISSPSWADHLEFYSIKVPQGIFTEPLKEIIPGDELLLGKKATGTLTINSLLPGKRLFLISTGTGIAPFASIIRDFETWEKFSQVILTHTCRTVDELKYGFDLENSETIFSISEFLERPLDFKFYSTTTRENFDFMGRPTVFFPDKLVEDLSISDLNSDDRFMLCGSQSMITDMREKLKTMGYKEGSSNSPSSFVYEKSFVS